MLDQKIQGFKPVILNVQPITTYQFLGWAEDGQDAAAGVDIPQDKLIEKEHLYVKEI